MAAQLYAAKNVHSKALLDYGTKKGHKQTIIAMEETDGEVTEETLRPQKKEMKRKLIEDSDEDCLDETPPKKFKLLPSKKATKKRVSKDTSKAKEYAKKRIVKQRNTNKSIEKERADESKELELDVSLPTEKVRVAEKSLSVSDMFATTAETGETEEEEYYNRRPSGRVASPIPSITPLPTPPTPRPP